MRVGLLNHHASEIVALSRVIDASRTHEVTWVAHDRDEALDLCRTDLPDIVLMDLQLRGLKRTELRRLIQQIVCPVLVVTRSIEEDSDLVYMAMDSGAIDILVAPFISKQGIIDGPLLLEKIDRIGLIYGKGTPPLRKRRILETPNARVVAAPSFAPLLAIGASTGGPQALAEILRNLPQDFSAAVLVVQHVEGSFLEGFAEWLKTHSNLPVSVASEYNHPLPGNVYLAASHGHLVVDLVGRMLYIDGPKELVHRPSVDVLFESLAKNWKGAGCAVLLTGMGRDGAEGLRTLKGKGWYTIVQNRESSIVYGMPRAAMQNHAARVVLPIGDIASVVCGHFA